jgi:outer membrane protein assembly factor BamB
MSASRRALKVLGDTLNRSSEKEKLPNAYFDYAGCGSPSPTLRVLIVTYRRGTFLDPRVVLCVDAANAEILWRRALSRSEQVVATCRQAVVIETSASPHVFRIISVKDGSSYCDLDEASFRELYWPEWPSSAWPEGFQLGNAQPAEKGRSIAVADPDAPEWSFLAANTRQEIGFHLTTIDHGHHISNAVWKEWGTLYAFNEWMDDHETSSGLSS